MAGRTAALAASVNRSDLAALRADPQRAAASSAARASVPECDVRPLNTIPVTAVKGIGEKVSEALSRLGIATVFDLLTDYPRRYEDRTRFVPVSDLKDGETASVLGRVTGVENRPTKNRVVLTRITLDDGSKSLAILTFFNQWRMKQTFERLVGKQIVAYGAVKRGFTSIEMTQPEWEALDEAGDSAPDSLSMGRIVPVYSATEGVGQKLLRKAIFNALHLWGNAVVEILPAYIREDRQLLPAASAVRAIHFPDSHLMLEAARRRLVYEELFVMQVGLVRRRSLAQRASGIAFQECDQAAAELGNVLPFSLTNAQTRVIGEIAADMSAPKPMNRLVQGDVGSGKTAVAIAAMLIAARNGYQSALMAPTEILAEQHLRVIRAPLEDLGIRVDLLTGSRPAREKEAVRQRIESGDAGVVVGTHALIQEGVKFTRLGLAVIDEQHRFGVLQRAALAGKGANPDVLVMTATPIPRTLTLTVYGDLDVSVIDELPPGRKVIRTHAKGSADKAGVYDGVRKLLREGRQAYVVCSLVEESDKLQARAASELASHLAQHVFPEYEVGLLHGQMPSADKDGVMARFRSGATHILVATTVIEVGVDVPNAAVMVIEDADRFGLAQLHQLRGRVGRGQHASFCVLVSDPKSADAQKRLQVMCETNDGFRIAEEDLQLRGPGDFYGVRQSGVPGLKIADIIRDIAVLKEAREDAFRLLAADPNLAQPRHEPLLNRLSESLQEADQQNMVDVA